MSLGGDEFDRTDANVQQRMERFQRQADVDRALHEAGYVSPLRRLWKGLTLAGYREARNQKRVEDYTTERDAEQEKVARRGTQLRDPGSGTTLRDPSRHDKY